MSVKVEIKNKAAEKIGEMELSEGIYNVPVSTHLLYQAVRIYQLNKRQGTASAKTRSEVKASTRKIYRQKGLGRARHGSISAPIFVGGGKAFPPKPKDWNLVIPKNLKRKALAQALSDRVRDDRFIILDSYDIPKPKTKEMVEVLKNHGLYGEKILVVYGEDNNNIYLASRNISGVEVKRAQDINAYDVLKKKYVLIDKKGVEILNKRLEK